ncbi:ORF60-2 [Ostreid herpesvirus 1]|nr:ORF60-2 [Ostreid herpesvirus 1]
MRVTVQASMLHEDIPGLHADNDFLGLPEVVLSITCDNLHSPHILVEKLFRQNSFSNCLTRTGCCAIAPIHLVKQVHSGYETSNVLLKNLLLVAAFIDMKAVSKSTSIIGHGCPLLSSKSYFIFPPVR